MIFHLQLCTAE